VGRDPCFINHIGRNSWIINQNERSDPCNMSQQGVEKTDSTIKTRGGNPVLSTRRKEITLTTERDEDCLNRYGLLCKLLWGKQYFFQ
jgi:hypothetical protein